MNSGRFEELWTDIANAAVQQEAKRFLLGVEAVKLA